MTRKQSHRKRQDEGNGHMRSMQNTVASVVCGGISNQGDTGRVARIRVGAMLVATVFMLSAVDRCTISAFFAFVCPVSSFFV